MAAGCLKTNDKSRVLLLNSEGKVIGKTDVKHSETHAIYAVADMKARGGIVMLVGIRDMHVLRVTDDGLEHLHSNDDGINYAAVWRASGEVVVGNWGNHINRLTMAAN